MARVIVEAKEKREFSFNISDQENLLDALEAKREELRKEKGVINVTWKPKKAPVKTTTIDSPIADAPYNVAFIIGNKEPQYYLKFGYLLEFIEENIIPQIVSSKTDNPPH